MKLIAQRLGMGMKSTAAFETFCVPTYFVDTAIPEDAGDGMVRIWNCATKGGMLVPQCEIIIRATRLIVAGNAVIDGAQGIFNKEMFREGVH